MSSASSNQSVVRDGTEYKEVYPSGHRDLDSPGEERSSSASSLSSTNEDMEMVEPEDASDDGEDQALGSVKPNVVKIHHANFCPFSYPLHPMGPS